MVQRGHGIRPDPWILDAELRHHIQNCPCPCDHMGYGNFLDYQVPPCPNVLPESETSFGAPVPPCHRDALRRYRHHYAGPYRRPSCSCSTSSTSDSSSRDGGSRSRWCLCLGVCIILTTIAAGLSLPFALNPPADGPRRLGTLDERLAAVRRLLRRSPLVDGHNDLPWNLRKFVHNRLSDLNLSSISDRPPWSTSRWSHTDIRRLRQGLLGAQFWSAYVPCKAQHMDAVQITLEQIDVVRRLVERHRQHFALVVAADELEKVHHQGRIASLIGVEGGHALGDSLAVLRTFYSLGARYLTITHSCDTPWAASGVGDGPPLSPFGRSVVREMNRLGMIVDLSHASAETARRVLNASEAPVIFSHSGAYALCNSTRNVPDDVLRLVAANDGLVMVNFYTRLVTCGDTATIADVVAHINHVRRVAGVRHVGIGAGYDGINTTPAGLEDVSRYPYLFAELLADPDWTEEDVAMLAGLNFMRVFRKVENVRDAWRMAEVQPVEDVIMGGRKSKCSSMHS